MNEESAPELKRRTRSLAHVETFDCANAKNELNFLRGDEVSGKFWVGHRVLRWYQTRERLHLMRTSTGLTPDTESGEKFEAIWPGLGRVVNRSNMNYQSLEEFWAANKQAIGKALPEGTDPLAGVLQAGADAFGLSQQVQDAAILWLTKEGNIALMFCVVPDPRDLDRVLDVFKLARDKRPRLTTIFVHQWTDGEGNWDAFLISPRGCLHHADRISGSATVRERGPELREDIYNLFARDAEFPAPGQAQWAQLLAGPREAVTSLLAALAGKFSCTQTESDHLARWVNSEGRGEAQFFILPNAKDIHTTISLYEQIRRVGCPVSFVFVECERPGLYDIFRLSARSYLEHHNQVKAWSGAKAVVSGKSSTPVKELKNLRWVPRWASHVGCIKGCLNYLGVKVSDAWLFGATGHAFVLNISPGLCPSGPTDWDTHRFLELARNLRKWTDRSGGLRGYEEWIHCLEYGTAGRFGLGYNAAVWAESRRFAVAFLREAKQRLKGRFDSLFQEAIAQYEIVARNLKTVSDAYPFEPCQHVPVPVDERARSTVAALKKAREAEVAGLAELAAIVEKSRTM